MHSQEQIREYIARERNGNYRNGEDVFWGAYYEDWGHFVNFASIRYNGEIYSILHETTVLHELDEDGEVEILAEIQEENLLKLLELPVLPNGVSFHEALKQASPNDVWGY